MKKELTQARLRELLSYDPVTGFFTWRKRTGDRGVDKTGRVAGTRATRGYWQISVDGRLYLAHRLVWMYVYGRWPINQIDHRNLDKSDNHFKNLREATPSQNGANYPSKLGTISGLRGVKWHDRNKMWMAHIRVNGKRLYLGYFHDKHEAHAAYVEAAEKYHGEFARTE